LLQIKPLVPIVLDTALGLGDHSVGARAVSPPQETQRYAVGTFDTWPQLREAWQDATDRGLIPENFNFLAREQAFLGSALPTRDGRAVVVQVLPFLGSAPIVCTSGPLADSLTRRRQSGARSLKDALACWLIPRHARHFEDAVAANKILLWIRVVDADDERRACQWLLAHSSNSVGVHDLVLPGE
jgi:hypothetical protein